MRAAVLAHPAAPLRLERPAVPQPEEEEILIAVRAAGVNPADWKVARGHTHSEIRRQFPLTPGFDLAGIVVATGPSVTGYKVGDEIVGVIWPSVLQHGTYADYTVASQDSALVRKPTSLSFEAASAIPTPGITALGCLRAAAVKSGDTVLVVGATGGVGGYVVQLAVAAGATVTATARPEAEEYVRILGAAEVAGYLSKSSSYISSLQNFLGGFDIIIDLVNSNPSTEMIRGLLRPGGRFVSTRYGADTRSLARMGISAHNIDMRAQAGDLEILLDLVSVGSLRVPIGHSYTLDQAAAALNRSQHGPVQGRIVLTMC